MEITLNGPRLEETRARFARIASRYDRANTILSFGIHHLWRERLAHDAKVRPGMRVLDCATGTGDLALRLAADGGEVVGVDVSPEMLAVAEAKAKRARRPAQFLLGDAMKLPFSDGKFDRVTIAFGIRNVERPLEALREFRRVAKKGGEVYVLEFGRVRLPVWRQVYEFFATHLLPRIGGWVTGERSDYEYLQESSAAFPCGEDFLKLFDDAGGYGKGSVRELMGGVAYLYRAPVEA